jgi:hypothetical protein
MGFIRRSAYTTRKGVYVPSHMVRNMGRRGKSPHLIGPLKSGSLSKFGYKSVSSKTMLSRHRALGSAMRSGVRPITIFRKLGAVSTLTKRTAPSASRVFKADQRWVVKYLKK